MQIIKDIYLDFYDNHFVTVNAKQNDTGRYIRAEIIKDGTGFEIPSGAVVSIASETIWNNCEVEGNKILAPLSKVMLDTAGERICQLEIVKGEEKLTTVSFQLKIEKSVRNDGAIEGNMELGVLDQAISDAKRITQEAETTEAARKTAENARISAENTRKNQETARVNAETSRVSAENTRKSQETARGTAESARVNAENTRKSQETGRVNAETARVTEFATLKADAQEATARAEAAAAGDISGKTVTYTESTAATAPASGSKLSLISGWLVGKVKNLVTRMGTAETSITALNSNFVGCTFYPNLFKNYTTLPVEHTAVVCPCTAYAVRTGKYLHINYMLTVEANTAAGNDAANTYFDFGMNLNPMKTSFFPNDVIKSCSRNECIYYKKSTGIIDIEKTSYGAYAVYNSTYNVMNFGRFYTNDGKMGAWPLKSFYVGLIIKGTIDIILQ
ncbi:hypothetical protein [Murimonas intestini]|uniref:DUF2479 domain-containing protein n=2 Tax=Murimonas intestini TaxID=1337051 RepID=A0AB73SZE1_9FIRM|nr:hypothetical protein [Murimonas intestini]MCR1842749.1 hypothetical protein [Murimonas intestini]MCR1867912.1 hypothetical protein [Murimonas intestini]MCR1885264.1 hypothetical protein [Murimonas intestini]